MADVIIPALLKKNISFIRLSSKNCAGYEIYGHFVDDSYDSGIRTELLEYIENPSVPNPVTRKITLPNNEYPTWELPKDMYTDRDHQFYLYQNTFIVSSMYYAYNRVTKMITLDTVLKPYEITDVMELEYYRDIIERSYTLENNCTIKIKPVFKQTATFGDHNVII